MNAVDWASCGRIAFALAEPCARLAPYLCCWTFALAVQAAVGQIVRATSARALDRFAAVKGAAMRFAGRAMSTTVCAMAAKAMRLA